MWYCILLSVGRLLQMLIWVYWTLHGSWNTMEFELFLPRYTNIYVMYETDHQLYDRPVNGLWCIFELFSVILVIRWRYVVMYKAFVIMLTNSIHICCLQVSCCDSRTVFIAYFGIKFRNR